MVYSNCFTLPVILNSSKRLPVSLVSPLVTDCVVRLGRDEKKTESLTVFQGFSEEQLKRISTDNIKVIGHAEKTINDKSDIK